MTTTFDRLRAILVKEYKLDPQLLTLDARLDAFGIDSLGLAELLFIVEDEFKITLPAELVSLTTLGAVVDYIDGLLAAQLVGALQTDVVTTRGTQAT
jgi:acyl carrier protein